MDESCSKIKEYIAQEIQGLVTFDKYDELFYVFMQIIEYDVGVPKVAGIRERLFKALKVLANDGITRDDLVDSYVAVTSCYEPFVKKCLFLIDQVKYNELGSDSQKTLPDYLTSLGQTVFLPKNSRTKKTDCIYRMYCLRTVEAHECVKKSLREMYDDLSHVFSAYLIIVEKQLDSIKKALAGSAAYEDYQPFELSQYKKMTVIDILWLLKEGIVNLPTMIKSYEEEGFCITFDQDGLITSSCYDENKIKDEYEYKFNETGMPCLLARKRFSEFESGGQIHKMDKKTVYEFTYEKDNEIRSCTYEDDGKIAYKMKMIREPDGGLHFRILRERKYLDHINDGIINRVESNTIHTIEDNYYFDCRGRLVKRAEKCTNKSGRVTKMPISEWIYEDGKKRIKDSKVFFETRIIGDEKVILRKEHAYDEGILYEKRKYQDGKLMCITKYVKNEKTENVDERHTNIEYY